MKRLLRCSSQQRRRSDVNPGIKSLEVYSTVALAVLLAGRVTLQMVQDYVKCGEVLVLIMPPQRKRQHF